MYDVNVLSIEWYAGNTWLDYYTVLGRVPCVGRDVSILLTALQNYRGLQWNQVHLVGHSLGAHAAGFAGKYVIGGKLARITGWYNCRISRK